jgi:hypothetical protein
VPPPNLYKTSSDFEYNKVHKKGRSFGISYDFYRKNYFSEFKHSQNPMYVKGINLIEYLNKNILYIKKEIKLIFLKNKNSFKKFIN